MTLFAPTAAEIGAVAASGEARLQYDLAGDSETRLAAWARTYGPSLLSSAEDGQDTSTQDTLDALITACEAAVSAVDDEDAAKAAAELTKLRDAITDAVGDAEA